MDVCREDPKNLAARAKAEKYAKILAKTIVNPDGDSSSYGQNAFFYDSAEGLLTAVVLLLAEYLPPEHEGDPERRHIVRMVPRRPSGIGLALPYASSHSQSVTVICR